MPRRMKYAVCRNGCILIVISLVTWLLSIELPHLTTKLKEEMNSFKHYSDALQASGGIEKTVVLVQIDSGYVEMAYNFYVASLVKNDISNYLFISLDKLGCAMLRNMFTKSKINCFAYAEHPNSSEASLFGTKSLEQKLLMKKFYVHEALKLGYTVLFSDADIVFLRDPFADLRASCDKIECDMAVQWDLKHKKYIAGFMFVRPTENTLKLYELINSFDNNDMPTDQKQLNIGINAIKRRKTPVRVIPLSYNKYPVGKPFFPGRACPKRNDYNGVIVIHNNYLMEIYNKIFRFKECLLWHFDGKDGYYSSTSRRYLTYQNSLQGRDEKEGLLNAFTVGKLLKRTVILPDNFYRENKMACNLMIRVYTSPGIHFMREFHQLTNGSYRESSFLRHPLVPDKVKGSLSPVYHIESNNKRDSTVEGSITLEPSDITTGPTVDELNNWFSTTNHAVLRFQSLYGDFKTLNYSHVLGNDLIKLLKKL